MEEGGKNVSEKKEKIIEAIGKEIPGMNEKDKTYLMGFLEGLAAAVGNQRIAASQPGG